MMNTTSKWTLALAMMWMVSAAVAQPVPRWLETEHDFGVFQEKDGKVSCIMRVVNEGDSMLLITRVRSSCGCTASEFTRSPIAPGDTGVVTITYNPAGRPGQFSKNVFVFTNAQPTRWQLDIKGHVIADPASMRENYPIEAGPLRLDGQIVPMGELVRNKSRMSYVRGYNASLDTLLVSASDSPQHLAPRAVPDTVAPGETTTITVYYDSQKAPLWGLNVDTLNIQVRTLAKPSMIVGTAQIQVMAQVTEDFSRLTDKQRLQAPVAHLACSERLDFGSFKPRQTVTRQTILKNNGKQTLEVRRLWSPTPGVTATIDKTSIKKGKTGTLQVTVDSALINEPLLNTMLNIITNDPASPRITVRLVGQCTVP